MLANMSLVSPNSVERALSWRRQDHPSDDDQAEAVLRKLPFPGDKAEGGPPLVWVMMWKRTYINCYGDLIPGGLKAWGYVFWDARRTVRSGGKDALFPVWRR